MEHNYFKASKDMLKPNRQAYVIPCKPSEDREPQVPSPNDPSKRKWGESSPRLLEWLQLPFGLMFDEADVKGWLKYEPGGTANDKEEEIRRGSDDPLAAEQITLFLRYIRLGARHRWPSVFRSAVALLHSICGDDEVVKPAFTPMRPLDFQSAQVLLDDLHIAYLKGTSLMLVRNRFDELCMPLNKVSDCVTADFDAAQDGLVRLSKNARRTVDNLLADSSSSSIIENIDYRSAAQVGTLRRSVRDGILRADKAFEDATIIEAWAADRLRKLGDAFQALVVQLLRRYDALYDRSLPVLETRGVRAHHILSGARDEIAMLTRAHHRAMRPLLRSLALNRRWLASPVAFLQAQISIP